MKKRLRKKLRVGEFQQLGLEVRFRLSNDLDDASVDAFWEAFISQAIEATGLMCGGGCGRVWDIFVTRTGHGSVTEDDRQAISNWLARDPRVSNIEVGSLVDAWYST